MGPARLAVPAPVFTRLLMLPLVLVSAEPRVKDSPVAGESVTTCALETGAL